jgi:glycerophosphoryl diester phosphodiesterase
VTLPDGLFSPPIAHRGLWRPDQAPENSLAAFDLACRHGFGIELDVRLSADGEAMVFHDETLERMTGVQGLTADRSAAELAALPLRGGPERIPPLQQVLDLVAGRGLLLVEIKDPPPGGALEARTAELLDAYAGPVAVISFDPGALAWFAAHRPDLPRGLDALGLGDTPEEASANAAFEAACARSKPHVLVLEKASAAAAPARKARAGGLPVIAWTVRSSAEARAVAGDADNLIFEGFVA